MKQKIIFWLDADITTFCLPYFLQKEINANFYAIIDITNRPKDFFINQKLVNFQKIWFYHDSMKKDFEFDSDYLKQFEEKYKIDLMELAKNDRMFNSKYNEYYNFSKYEIISILHKECKLFEEVLEIQPDFFITTETALRPHHTFYLYCKKNGIKILMLNFANWGNYCYISENYHQLDNFEELFKNKQSLQTTFEQLQKRLDEKIQSKKLTNFYNKTRKSKFKKIKAAIQLLFISNNNNIKTHYTYFGRTKSRVLFKEIKNLLKFWFRQWYIDNSFLIKTPETKPIIFFTLQQEPERSLLISAPNYTDQMKTIDYISRCIPDNYILLVKEHPTQGPGRGWRNLSDYKYFKNFPKVKFIHPSISTTDIIKKSKLVISVSGTPSLEASFFNKPSITFVKNDFTLIPSIQKLNSKDDLPKLIQNSLQKTFDPQFVGKYFDILEEQSFIFDYLNLQLDYASYFYFDGNLVDIEIDESEMMKFLSDHKKSFSVVIERFKQKINCDEQVD
ncbi:MAG: hypothetical protein IIA83_09505 [Thaumarchaeota archaeon]|nr:hypothetical protein [Nitrososphaerota archaeon]